MPGWLGPAISQSRTSSIAQTSNPSIISVSGEVTHDDDNAGVQEAPRPSVKDLGEPRRLPDLLVVSINNS